MIAQSCSLVNRSDVLMIRRTMKRQITSEQRVSLLADIAASGVLPTAKAIGISRNALTNALAGLECHAGTIALIDAYLTRQRRAG